MKKILLILFLSILPLSPAFAGKVYDRVMESGTIRCGYAMWTPILYAEPNTGELKGIFHDLMEEAGKRLGLKIEWAEETGWGTLVEGMATDRYDMLCTGLYHSTGRAKIIGFGLPVFYSPLHVAAKKEDMRFDRDVTALNNPAFKIVVLEGEISSIAARQIFPKAETAAMPQMQDYALILKEIETGKGDATLVEVETFKNYDAANPDKLKLVGGPVSIFPTSVGLPRDDMAFGNMINTAIEELTNDGTIDRILKKHEKYPEAFLRVAKPYDAPERSGKKD
ncbi:MAG: transporter substrate-binding domain-containing protein [Alphaproteobacteria bacterium]|nr:transporter substrate-binding domain-containing protein [Alphaproteobacteria bacterium]